jgi:hypothetical protein
MHATNSTRSEDAYPSHLRGDHRARNRRCARHARRKDRGQIRAAYFCHAFRLRKKCDLFRGEPNHKFSMQDTDRGRGRSRVSHGCFHRACGLQIQRPRQSVRNHGGLQGHDRLSCGNRNGYVFTNGEKFLQPVSPSTHLPSYHKKTPRANPITPPRSAKATLRRPRAME